jgi:hypothetical protein
MKKTRVRKKNPKLKNVFIPEQAHTRIKKLCAGTAYIQQWILNAASAAYLSETGLDLLEPDEHETNHV